MPADDSRPSGHNNGGESADDVILSEQTAAPGLRAPAPPSSLTAHDLATPYVLDALDLEDRDAFEQHLATCEECQRRVGELEDAALLLPDALVSPPADLPDAFPFLLRDVAHETLPISAASTRYVEEVDGPDSGDAELPVIEGRPADEADGFTLADSEPTPLPEPEIGSIEEAPSPEETVADEEPARAAPAQSRSKRNKAKQAEARAAAASASEAGYPARPARPPGRIRPGVRPPVAESGAAPASTLRGLQITPAVLAALALGVVALGLFLWALLLLGRVGDLQDEIDQQNVEISALRQQANATAWTLTPTSAGPAGASGTFFFSLPDQQGALVVRGLEPAPEGWAYQLWFIRDDEAAPIADRTFQVDENGEVLLPLAAEFVTFDGVAVSLEPVGGSPAPTSQVILQGRLGGAAG